jgi:hypothetical protein
MKQKLQFSGHESFHCRQLWLKKGYDFVASGKKFSAESSVIDLGVGKNMVTAIRHWMKSFDMISDSDELTKLASTLFDEETGLDKHLENDGTLWLLHYHLTKKGYASIFKLVFTELRKSKPEFTKKHFISLVSNIGQDFSEATLSKDFTAFQNMYVASKNGKSDIEDSYSGILTELGIVNLKEDTLVIESKRRPELPALILLYAIVENEQYEGSHSISFDQLYNDSDSIGSIFALNKEGLVEKLDEITKTYPGITFKNEAGVRELQFIRRPNPFTVLKKYYGS